MSDPQEPLALLFRDLRSGPDGLSGREAARRLLAEGPNELSRRRRLTWPGEIGRQLVHPLPSCCGWPRCWPCSRAAPCSPPRSSPWCCSTPRSPSSRNGTPSTPWRH
ncbi:cation-transporting P-type ATPase [Candidatus Frankia alpina]|uniref:cation-transporting P-type ATPase n=1 Tax=Candidatus Frankia alpina TaxID=2699483 RepID=UPI0013D7E65B|nr:cation-transporting P-type ATPase [Candidatus Frankia alpina]